MSVSRYNKAVAAAIASGITGVVIAAFPDLDQEVTSAIGVLLTTVLVWRVPNRS